MIGKEREIIGTNYYMIINNKKLAETYFSGEYITVNDPCFGYEVHIGKRSWGWKPLFQTHEDAYHSVVEMKEFITQHSQYIRIFDEYGKEFTLEQLEEELINWGEHQEIRYMKYVPEGVPDEIFGGKKYLVEGTKDDYDITIPFDHVEYEKLDPYGTYKKYWYLDSYYMKDKDGYNFMKGEFS